MREPIKMGKDKIKENRPDDDGREFKIILGALAVLLIAVVLGASYFFFGLGFPGNDESARVSGTTIIPAKTESPVKILSAKPEGETQKVELTASGLTYLPNPVELKVGVPIELSVSPRISSCMATMVASDLGIRVSSRGGPVYFVPEKAGEYPFTCWMNMGRGRFVFKE